MNIVFLGANKGIGRALSRLMAQRGDRIFLLGRHAMDLNATQVDLQARGAAAFSVPNATGYAVCDLQDNSTFAPALDAAFAQLGTVDTVVVTAGIFATQTELEQNSVLCERVLNVDFTQTIVFCEMARKKLLAQTTPRRKTLCVFSSVAGERGRKPVAIYGAAKAGLSRYLEAVDHKFHAEGLSVVCIKPGFIRTSMTEGLPEPPFAADPETIAPNILKAIDRGTPVIYAPRIWRLIMAVIRNLPRAVMRRLSF